MPRQSYRAVFEGSTEVMTRNTIGFIEQAAATVFSPGAPLETLVERMAAAIADPERNHAKWVIAVDMLLERNSFLRHIYGAPTYAERLLNEYEKSSALCIRPFAGFEP